MAMLPPAMAKVIQCPQIHSGENKVDALAIEPEIAPARNRLGLSALWDKLTRLPPPTWLCLWAVLAAIQIISAHWYLAVDSASYLSISRSLALDRVLANLGSPQLAYSIGYPL